MAARLAAAGTPTTLVDVPDWGRHPDFRPVITTGFKGDKPVLVKTALTTNLTENDGLIFGHDVHLSKTGGVARQAMELGKASGYGAPLTCDNCHKRAPDGGFVKIDMPHDCGACHSLTFARKNGVDQQLKHGYPSEVVAQLKLYYANQPNFSAGPELFIGRPGLRGGTPRAGRPVDYVADSVRNAFERGGTCTTCHTFFKPPAGSLEYKIQPVRITARYLPWGDFNHNVPEHRQDGSGAETCKSCHKAESSKLLRRRALAQDRRMRHLPRQDQGRNRQRRGRRLRRMPRIPQSRPAGLAPGPGTGRQCLDPDTLILRILLALLCAFS